MATVNELIKRAGDLLIDPLFTFWTKQELLDYYNDAVRAVIIRRPDAYVEQLTFTCVAGTEQKLPADAIRLIEVERNHGGAAVRYIPRATLDESYPDWQRGVSGRKVSAFTYDERNPTKFFLFPGPRAALKVDIVYSKLPIAVKLADIDLTESSVLSDIYINPVLDFMLFRAFSKNAEYAPNAARATSHFQAFAFAIGDKTETDSALADAKAKGYTGE